MTVPFQITNYPSTSHTYPVGTRFYCSAEINDSFFNDVLSSASLSTWTPKGSWDGDTSAPNGYIEVVNTIPQKAVMASIDRDNLSRLIFTRVSSGVDPDVFIVAEGGQSLSYFARIFVADVNLPPASYGTNLIKGDFNTADSSGVFSQTLTMERDFCSEGRVFDGIEYSPVSNKKCSLETPFNPDCPDFTVVVSPPESVCVNNPEGKTSVISGISCARNNAHIDEDWNLGIFNAQVKNANQFVMPVSGFIGITDCNETVQTSRVVYDSNIEGIYSIEYYYGGLYNNVPLSCTKQIQVITKGCDSNNPVIYENNSSGCSSLGFLVSNLRILPKANNKTDVNFAISCTRQTAVNLITLKRNSAIVAQSYVNPSYNINCPAGSLVNVSSTFDSNAAGSYDLFIDFNSSACRAVASFNVSPAGVSLEIPKPETVTVPDSNPFVLIIVALVALFILLGRNKKGKKINL